MAKCHTAALRAVSLSIAAGTTTAIVARRAPAKSTFADVLLGLMTPSHGRIVVDATATLTADCLRSLARPDWLRIAGIRFCFHDTPCAANLLWARPDAYRRGPVAGARTGRRRYVRGGAGRKGLETVVRQIAA
jgi:energy-coupling factor transporter ATP-binding protein EcfA2